MKLQFLAIAALLCSTLAVPVSAGSSIRAIDFNNFTYRLAEGGIGPSGVITLSQGHYKEPDSYSFVELNSITYQDFDGNGTEEALVTLGASGGGSGYSTHGFVFTDAGGSVKSMFYQMNFQSMEPYAFGFTIRRSSPLSTGKMSCPNNFLLGADVMDIRLYQWSGTTFVPIRKTTLKGKQLCNLFF